jgi:hypothetical protein
MDSSTIPATPSKSSNPSTIPSTPSKSSADASEALTSPLTTETPARRMRRQYAKSQPCQDEPAAKPEPVVRDEAYYKKGLVAFFTMACFECNSNPLLVIASHFTRGNHSYNKFVATCQLEPSEFVRYHLLQLHQY